jgi:hypothetical protein
MSVNVEMGSTTQQVFKTCWGLENKTGTIKVKPNRFEKPVGSGQW